MRCIDLCWVWLLSVLFVVVCRLALRLVALCVVRCAFSSCVLLWVALNCVAFGCFVCCSLWCVVSRSVWLVRCGFSSCVDLCVALICVGFGCFVCCSLWFVVLRCVCLLCVLCVVFRLALICALR